MKTIELIKELANTLPVKHKDVDNNGQKERFYDLYKRLIDNYTKKLKQLDEKDYNNICIEGTYLNASFKDILSASKYICDKMTNILELCYASRMYEANKNLSNLLTCKKLINLLGEELINRFKVNGIENCTLYRIVDVNKTEVSNINSGHVPFDKRYLIGDGRFNISGCPCLYMSNNWECAIDEIGALKESNTRLVFSYKPKANSWFLNLVVPTEEWINDANGYELSSFILLYPLFVLCLTCASNGKSSFNEEYMISQLLYQVIFYQEHNDYTPPCGIKFTSTKNKNCINYVVPVFDSSAAPALTGSGDNIEKNFEQLPIQIATTKFELKPYIQ